MEVLMSIGESEKKYEESERVRVSRCEFGGI